MIKHFLKFFLVMLFVTQPLGCGGKERRERKSRRTKTLAEMPAPGSKLVLIFPAGVGAARVILGILEHMENDLGVNSIGSVIEMAGGVSSGALTAAALTYGKTPKFSAKKLKPELRAVVKAVFPEFNDLVRMLVTYYSLTYAELETVFVALMKKEQNRDFTSMEKAKATLTSALSNIPLSVLAKINNKGGIDGLGAKLTELQIYEKLVTINRSEELRKSLVKLLEDTRIDDEKNARLISIASNNGQAVFFASPTLRPFLTGPLAVAETSLHDSLIASSAVPGFFDSSRDINFMEASGGQVFNIPDLDDGIFAVGFDPSAAFYEVFTRQFADDDLFIVYVGNGAQVDKDFRQKILAGKFDIAQKTLANGKRVTFAPIDAKIVDDDKNDLFFISGFYVDDALTKYMDAAVKKAIESPGYQWVIKALKEILKK